MIKDSGERTQFYDKDGKKLAVRDMSKGKGKFIYMPYDVISEQTGDDFFLYIDGFRDTGDIDFVYRAMNIVAITFFGNVYNALIEVSKHFEEGVEKYGFAEDGKTPNWKLGVPISSYIDSATRHYCKHKAYDTSERHDRATLWNLICLVWTMKNKPEMDDFTNQRKVDITFLLSVMKLLAIVCLILIIVLTISVLSVVLASFFKYIFGKKKT